jgi:hypothetical protein
MACHLKFINYFYNFPLNIFRLQLITEGKNMNNGTTVIGQVGAGFFGRVAGWSEKCPFGKRSLERTRHSGRLQKPLYPCSYRWSSPSSRAALLPGNPLRGDEIFPSQKHISH